MQLTRDEEGMILVAGGNQADITAAESGEVKFDFEALGSLEAGRMQLWAQWLRHEISYDELRRELWALEEG